MNSKEITEIKSYLDELEANLMEQELGSVDMQICYSDVYKLIERLMEATFQCQDQDRKVLLAAIEYKARRCYEHIKMRLQPMN